MEINKNPMSASFVAQTASNLMSRRIPKKSERFLGRQTRQKKAPKRKISLGAQAGVNGSSNAISFLTSLRISLRFFSFSLPWLLLS